MPSDEELMTAASEGDMEAFEELVRRHSDRAYRVALTFLGDEQKAEDLAQEAFLKILEAADSYRPTASFTTYLYRVVANACLDYRKKKRPTSSAQLPDREDHADGPPEELARRGRRDAVRRAINSLPERQRMALVLQYYEGLSYAETAEAMDCTESAVDSLLVRARRKMRRKLDRLL